MIKRDVFHKYDNNGNNQKGASKRLTVTTPNKSEYIVRKGDTLYKIASLHNITVTELIEANNLQTNVIYPNQIIVIPRKVSNGNVYFEEYIIQHNDTIEKVATSLGVGIDALMKYNDFSKLVLQENQVIRFPIAYQRYNIDPTDSLESILERTGMTLLDLVNANRSNWLAPGKPINIR